MRAAAPASLLICGCAPRSPTPGPPTKHALTSPQVTAADLRRRLSVVADDSLQGRGTGSSGHDAATAYIVTELARLGVRPAGDHGTYFQEVPGFYRFVADSQTMATDAGQAFVAMRDFVAIYPNGRPREFRDAEVIFGGVLEDPGRRISAADANGRFVILIYGNPRNNAGNIRTAEFDSSLAGAAAIATVNPPRAMSAWLASEQRPSTQHAPQLAPDRLVPAAMAVSAATAAALLGRVADSTVPIGHIGRRVSGRTPYAVRPVVVRNVVGVLTGADSARAGEMVALGAHSDHLDPSTIAFDHDSVRTFNRLARRAQQELAAGAGARAGTLRVDVDSLRRLRPARPDSVFNGADDDGSGTVALLEIAEALVATPATRPRRSVLFVWHAAEELGLLGSTHFTDHPTVARESIIAQLNLDMIGRGTADDIAAGGADYLQVIGWRRRTPMLGDIIEEVNRDAPKPFRFDLTYDAAGHRDRLFCRSDHFSYARFGIPVAFFTTGAHADYHRVTDEAEYIDFDKLTRVTDFVRRVTLALGNRTHWALDDGAGTFDPHAPCRQ